MKTRRNFLKQAGTLVAASALVPQIAIGNQNAEQKKSNKIEVGLASITFGSLSLKEMLVMSKKLGMTKVSLKAMHAPLDSTKDQLAAIQKTVKDMEMKIVSAGVIYMKTEQEVDNAFQYAKNLGINRIVGVPNYEILDYVEKLVKEYDIRMAIHNHGPDNLPYETPYVAFDKIKDRDFRMGLCIDPGHVVRAGIDPVEAVKKVGNRIQELHFWDTDKAEKAGKACMAGTGIMNIPDMLKTLIKVGFTGYINIEYLNEDMEYRPAYVAQSAGYLNGVLASI